MPLSVLAVSDQGTLIGAVNNISLPAASNPSAGTQVNVGSANGTVTAVPDYQAIGTQGINGAGGENAAGPGAASLAQTGIQALGTCSIGAIIGKMLASIITTLINQLLGVLKNVVIDAFGDLFTDPKGVTSVRVVDEATNKNTGAISNKVTGVYHAAPTGILDWIGNVSLDSIMFCIVNEILTYITQSTIQWINSGFKGNPVFVQNPQALMQHIADQEAGNFVHNLAGGVQQGVNGGKNNMSVGLQNGAIQMFDPIRQQVVMNTIGGYNGNNNLSSQLQCPMTPAQYNMLNSGARWNSSFNDALMMAGDPRCNSYGATTFITNPYMQQRTTAAQQSQSTLNGYGQGVMSFTTCPPNRTRYDGSCDPGYLQVTSSGKMIGDDLQSRGMMKYMRVSMAKDFDSIVTALVNQLIKIAVNKIFEGAQPSSAQQGATQGAIPSASQSGSSQSSSSGGGSSGQNSNPAPVVVQPVVQPQPVVVVPPPVPTATTTIINFAFAPTILNVAVGTRVTWINNDNSPHTVTADNAAFGSEILAPGQSFTFTFHSAGTFTYHCNIHPSMTGAVLVGQQ